MRARTAATARGFFFTISATPLRLLPEAVGQALCVSVFGQPEATLSGCYIRPWRGSGYSSTRSTARKASCGMSTVPTRFIRFLPSFCFSSSLRLRLMSPP